jgi:hypothetical protein
MINYFTTSANTYSRNAATIPNCVRLRSWEIRSATMCKAYLLTHLWPIKLGGIITSATASCVTGRCQLDMKHTPATKSSA